MKHQSFCTILGFTTLTSIAALSFSLSPSFSQETSAPNQPDKLTFLCRSIFDKASGEQVPATIAWIPERRGNVRFIAWKSEYFEKSGWTTQKRCEEVTKKFQAAYEQGRLEYLTTGQNNGYPIICTVNIHGNCNGSNQLFTLKDGSNSELVLQQLTNIATGRSSEPLWQSSGEKTYFDVQKFLNNAPLLNIQR